MTDPEIAAIVFREVIGREGSPGGARQGDRRLPRATCPTPSPSRDGYRVMPGIEELLDRLIDDGVLLGLVTGNIEAAAHIKLARAGLNRFFSFGGYGSDSADRTEVTEAAAAPRRAGLRRHPRATAPASRSATPPATSRPATAPGSRSSASPPAATRSRNCARPAPTGRSRPSRTAFPPETAGCCVPIGRVNRTHVPAAVLASVQRAW